MTFPHHYEKNTVSNTLSNTEKQEEAGETNMSENNWSTLRLHDGLVLLQACCILLWRLWWKAEVPTQCATRSSSLRALACLFHLTVSGVSSKLREDIANMLWVWYCLVGPITPMHSILEQIYQFITLRFCVWCIKTRDVRFLKYRQAIEFNILFVICLKCILVRHMKPELLIGLELWCSS